MKKYIVAVTSPNEDEDGNLKMVFHQAIECNADQVIEALDKLCQTFGKDQFGQGKPLRADDLDPDWMTGLRSLLADDAFPEDQFVVYEDALAEKGMNAGFVIGEESVVKGIRYADYKYCKFTAL